MWHVHRERHRVNFMEAVTVESAENHQEIVDAILRHRAEAAGCAMRKHLENVSKLMLASRVAQQSMRVNQLGQSQRRKPQVVAMPVPDAIATCRPPPSRRRIRAVFVGWGAINGRVGSLLAARNAAVEIVGIATLNTPENRALIPSGVRFLASPCELAELHPDIVVEAAGRAAIDIWAEAALVAAPTVIIASTSAFCDEALLTRLVDAASRHGSRILIPSGAIGAIDALASGCVLGLEEVTHQIVKPPAAWKGTPAEKMLDLATLAERTVFFSGTAREAASAYPQNANATVVTSLAGIGLDNTRVEMVADPTVRINGHRIMARGAFGRLEIVLENNPLATNPKSSELTALSLVRLIEHQTQSIIV